METTVKFNCKKPEHNNSLIVAVCHDKKCSLNRLLCTKCILKDHCSHSENIVLLEDIEFEIKKFHDKKDILSDFEYRKKIDEIIQSIQTKILDELDKVKQKILEEYQNKRKDLDILSQDIDLLIDNNIYSKINRIIHDSFTSNESISDKIKALSLEDDNVFNDEFINQELTKMEFSIPLPTKISEFFELPLNQIKNLNELFKNQTRKIIKFSRKVISPDCTHDLKENKFKIINQSSKNHIIFSEDFFSSGYCDYEFTVEAEMNKQYYSGFGVLDLPLVNSASEEWPDAAKSCYLNLTQFKSNNLSCNKNVSDLEKVFKPGETKIKCVLDFIYDTFTIKILDFTFTNTKSYELRNNQVKPFFLLYKGGINGIKFYN